MRKDFLLLTLIYPLLLCGPTWFLAYIPPKTTWVQMEAPLKISFFLFFEFFEFKFAGSPQNVFVHVDKPLPSLPPSCEQTFFSGNPFPSLFHMVYGCRHTEQTYNFPMKDFGQCNTNARYFKNLDKILDDFEQNKIFGQKVSWNNFE